MKNFCTVLLALSVCSVSFSQISEIIRLPVQNPSQSIKESVPVWLSQNEILIFFVNESMDTIFSCTSNDRGLNWEEPKFEFVIDSLGPNQELIYPAALSTKSGRLVFAWSVIGEGIHLSFSDNSGSNWSQQQIVLGTGSIPAYQKNLYNIKLSQLDDEKIIVCFNPANEQGTLYYKFSSDDGVSWSDTSNKILRNGYWFNDHSIISVGSDSLMCIFKLQRTLSSNFNVYARFSFDNGDTWGDTVNLSGYGRNEIMPRISKDNVGNIWLAYLRTEVFSFPYNTNFTVGDIYYKKSTDEGITWNDEKQLTHFIGDDNYLSLNASGSSPFVSYSTVKFHEVNQIAFGILDETIETYTPPYLFDGFSLWSNDPDSTLINAYVKDDNEVESVKLYFEDSLQVFQLFDDGLHDDYEAGDGVFGNKVLYDFTKPGENLYFNVNKVKIPFSNNGIIADVQVRDSSNTVFILRDVENNIGKSIQRIFINIGSQGRYEEGTFLFSSGFFISGYINSNLFANGVASSCLLEDYLPGKVGSDPEDPLNVIYVVSKDDLPFGSSWQRWKDAVLLGADFYDGNKDGSYNPVDLNWNGTWDINEDMPPLIGDKTAWCVYNDGVPADQRRIGFEFDPIGVEIQQTLFATNNPELENVVFIKYKLTNSGLVSEDLDSIFFSPWDDTDLGSADDDLGGCDTILQSLFTYNNLDDFVYGNNPPAIFTSVLQGPIVPSINPSDTAYLRNGILIGEEVFAGFKNLGLYSFAGYTKGDIYQGDPRDIAQVWNYVHARDRYGYLLNPCEISYGRVYGNVDCSQVNPMYWFSGDPVTQIGWLDIRALDDRKFSSIGPIALEKDKPQEIIIAYVLGRGTDYFNSITVARENVQRAIAEYESNFAYMTYSPPPATNPIDSYVLYQNYPNPFNPVTTIRYDLPQDGQVTIDIFDILGQRVTTLVNEYKKADRYEVSFNAIGLASGVYIYQLRVNDFITSKKMVLVR